MCNHVHCVYPSTSVTVCMACEEIIHDVQEQKGTYTRKQRNTCY